VTPEEQIVQAVFRNDLEKVYEFLEEGVDPNTSLGEDFGNIIFRLLGHPDILKLAIEKGADIDVTNKWGQTPLIVAAESLDTESFEILTDAGANKEYVAKNGSSAIKYASYIGDFDLVQTLLLNNANTEPSLSNTKSALMLAMEGDSEEHDKIVELLIEHGADPCACNTDNNQRIAYSNRRINTRHCSTPLLSALKNRKFDIYVEMLEHLEGEKACVNDPLFRELVNLRKSDGEFGIHLMSLTDCYRKQGNEKYCCLLVQAARMGDYEKVLEYINKGVNVNSRCFNKETPLMNAVFNSDAVMLELLVKLGANVNQKNSKNETPLMLAVKNGKYDVVKMLLDHGARAYYDPAVLVFAIKYRDDELVELLLDRGARTIYSDKNGITPLMHAIINHRLKIAKIIVYRGSNILSKDNKGMSALDHLLSQSYYYNGNSSEKDDWYSLIFEFIESGAYIRGYSTIEMGNLLESAASYGRLKSVRRLVESGAPVTNDKLPVYFNPLFQALHNGHVDVASYLIGKGAPTDSPKILETAVQSGNVEAVRLMLDHYEKTLAANRQPESNFDDITSISPYALLKAVEGGNIDIVRLLLEFGFDPNSRYPGIDGGCVFKEGESAVEIAKRMGYHEILKLLFEYGAVSSAARMGYA